MGQMGPAQCTQWAALRAPRRPGHESRGEGQRPCLAAAGPPAQPAGSPARIRVSACVRRYRAMRRRVDRRVPPAVLSTTQRRRAGRRPAAGPRAGLRVWARLSPLAECEDEGASGWPSPATRTRSLPAGAALWACAVRAWPAAAPGGPPGFKPRRGWPIATVSAHHDAHTEPPSGPAGRSNSSPRSQGATTLRGLYQEPHSLSPGLAAIVGNRISSWTGLFK